MQKTRSFIKKNRKGNVVKIVKEHYLRDDIWCGSSICQECGQSAEQTKLSDAASQYLLPDTNVVLHQMDLLESKTGAFNNIIVLQTVLQEVKHRNYKLYQRMRTLLSSNSSAFVFANEHHRDTYVERLPGESPNDRNDRAIRRAAKWYNNHLRDEIKILLLTNDADNRAKAERDGLSAQTIHAYVRELAKASSAHAPLLELLAQTDASYTPAGDKKAGEWEYEPHLSAEELKARLESGKVKKGTFRVDRDYWTEATVSIKDKSSKFGQTIFIPGMQLMNRAIDGDIVAIELLPESQWKAPSTRLAPAESEEEAAGEKKSKSKPDRKAANVVRPTGKIVGIFERRWRPYCGSFEITDKKTGNVLFLSVNKRIPKIRVESRQIESLMDKRILVQIDSWPASSHYPIGHYIRTLGDIGDRDTETTVLLIEHDIPVAPWSNAVLKCLPPENATIPPEEIAKRVDHRKTRIFSIDPPGCKDIDDALHVEALPNGNLMVGVHIADVAHYIQPDSALDQEAANRGTSVYLVNKRIDMIPTLLSTDMCSLHANVERLCFSVAWEMTHEAEIVDTQFYKSVIKSVGAFSYAQAQDMLDHGDEKADPNVWACRTMNKLAKILKKGRMNDGALTLASPEVRFVLDQQSQQPTDVEMYQLKEAHSLVEEFMLLANVSVAKQTLKAFPTFACLRRHPAPGPENFEPLLRAARTVGVTLNTSSSRALADSLDRAVRPFPDKWKPPTNETPEEKKLRLKQEKQFNFLIRILATRCMSQAVYFGSGDVEPKEYHHYGLASPVYTHFTSPIRRYADVVVHRLLAASLGLAPLPKAIQDREHMREVCDCINHRHRMAELAGRASTELYTLMFFRNKRVEEEGMVIAVRSNGLRVFVPKFGIEGSITLFREPREGEPAARNPYLFDEENLTLTGPGHKFKIFDPIRVVIFTEESKARRQWLVVDLADGSNPNKKGERKSASSSSASKVAGQKRSAASAGADEKLESKDAAAGDDDEQMKDAEQGSHSAGVPSPAKRLKTDKSKKSEAAASSSSASDSDGKQAKRSNKGSKSKPAAVAEQQFVDPEEADVEMASSDEPPAAPSPSKKKSKKSKSAAS